MQKVAFVASMLIASSEAVGTMVINAKGLMTGYTESTCEAETIRESPIDIGTNGAV
jgi:hypothetical protein